MQAEAYLTHPKHILKPNGLFEWERTTDERYRCSHPASMHLDGGSICLDKGKTELIGTCICEEFTPPNQTISAFTNIPKKKLPRKEQTEDLLVKDGKITQDDQSKFFKQYGII